MFSFLKLHFKLLNKPQIAILSHESFSSYDVGVSWWSIDHHLGIRHSQLNSSLISYGDLRRYNTIIIPNGYNPMSDFQIESLKNWVRQGGTLIAHNNSVRDIISRDGFGNVVNIQDSFENINDYNVDLHREILALSDNIDIDASYQNKNLNKFLTQ